MKAAQYNSYGGPDVIEINSNAPEPMIKPNQVLVQVFAASLNPFDWKVRAGYMKDMISLQFPVTIGGNFSGVITKIGEQVSQFKVGDEVYGQSLVMNGASGSIAELASVNEGNIAKKPTNTDHIQASALPLVGSSAIQAIEQHIGLKSNQRIFITGGSGGIGAMAIQLAKHLGAYVATIATGTGIEYARSLGADEVLDYKAEKFQEKLKDFDAVYDTVGGEVAASAIKTLKKGGIIVSMVGKPDPKLTEEYGIKAIGQNTDTSSKNLNRLKELVEAGVIKVVVDKVFPLEQTREAFSYFETSHSRGKVVVQVR